MSNKLILYSLDLSPPVRTVKIVARLLSLDLELRNVNLLEKEQFKESYLKLNPECVIPTLVDDDFVIWDSHTICAYLVDKYGNDDSLYPKDSQLRAKCNQRLFFDAASLFVRLRDCIMLIVWNGGKEVPPEKVELMYTAFDILEKFLATDPFLVGKSLTIADISLSVSVNSLEIFAPLKPDEHQKILAWIKHINQIIPFFGEVNSKSIEQLRDIVNMALENNRKNA